MTSGIQGQRVQSRKFKMGTLYSDHLSQCHEFVFKVSRPDARQVRADLQYRTRRALKAEGIIKSHPSSPLEALGVDVKPDIDAIASEDTVLDVKPDIDADDQARTEDIAFLAGLNDTLDLLHKYKALRGLSIHRWLKARSCIESIEATRKKVAERVRVSIFIFSSSSIRLIRRLASAEGPGSWRGTSTDTVTRGASRRMASGSSRGMTSGSQRGRSAAQLNQQSISPGTEFFSGDAKLRLALTTFSFISRTITNTQ